MKLISVLVLSIFALAACVAPSANQSDAHKFTLVFDGFHDKDFAEIEDRISTITGYENHGPLKTSLFHAEYFYDTEAALMVPVSGW